MSFEKVSILGAGSWGTALAVWLAARGQPVTLWGHDPAHIARLRATGLNETYLPGVSLPPEIEPVADLACVAGSDLVLFVTPSRTLRQVAGQLAAVPLAPGAALLSCTKGIEFGSGCRMSQVLAECLPECRVAVLSGPSHAEEVSRHSPTALVIGASDTEPPPACKRFSTLPPCAPTRATTWPALNSAGALKNIFAIAAGVGDGLGFGDNAKAALVTRCARRTRAPRRASRRSEARRSRGLSGIGDLMVTCFSRHSRNRQGRRTISGAAKVPEAIAGSMSMVAEGVPTTRSAHRRRAGARASATPVHRPGVRHPLRGSLAGRRRCAGCSLREPSPERDE